MSRIERIPAGVRQLIEELQDKSNPLHVRHNYARTLEDVMEACNHAIWEFRNRKGK